MSKARMQDLQAALERDGWEISSEYGLFEVEQYGVVNWKIVHQETGVTLDLAFPLFEHLGRRTEDLNDIHYCRVVQNPKASLSFTKRHKEEWLPNLAAFVRALDALARAES